MIVAGTFLYLICCSVITSANIYGARTYGGEEWWTQDYSLKFYSPSGKNYFIGCKTGELSLEFDPAEESVTPYISFVTVNLKVYDIYFEQGDPRIDQKKVNFTDESVFIRHRLQSFVGPDKQTYKISYRNLSDIVLEAENPTTERFDNLHIKTVGPFGKWVHTYSFSENGDAAIDITLSPAAMSADRSIPVLEIKEELLTNVIANINTPSGQKYLITNELNVARGLYEINENDETYISFIEPNGKEYEIVFQNDGMPNIVEKDSASGSPFFALKTVQLESFVGPDKKLYQINHQVEDEADVLTIELSPHGPAEFQVNFVVIDRYKYYKNHIKFVFSDEGNQLIDRVDEFDSTPLSQQPPVNVEEVEIDSEVAKTSFLTFYSPSGKVYYLTPGDVKFAVGKGVNDVPGSPYISFYLHDGRKSNIYYNADGDTEMTFSPANDEQNSTTTVSLVSFVTPDRKLHKILSTDDVPYIDMTAQPLDPFDEKQEEALRIIIKSDREYNYVFTWNGDKLVKTAAYSLKRVSSTVLKSLIG
ncbi:hypothetical protein Bhyg_10030 [Pseudolycoriella hygida]|uniref:Uncharacterized protein n=1 Tax=Pseudolycoriella hygida TaxID=35572 RepID=A0A9Q0MSP7_9DIPT|nr:hypothetical protein Bhyg_10030 [Pseudolycoriella hygida]